MAFPRFRFDLCPGAYNSASGAAPLSNMLTRGNHPMTSHPRANDVLESKARLPNHVVYRTFVTETVVLNLQSGRYHGLNPSGGRMLEVMTSADSVREAAKTLADEYQRTAAEIEEDLVDFCSVLVDRGLIELSRSAAGE
jgi:hypothetical protein